MLGLKPLQRCLLHVSVQFEIRMCDSGMRINSTACAFLPGHQRWQILVQRYIQRENLRKHIKANISATDNWIKRTHIENKKQLSLPAGGSCLGSSPWCQFLSGQRAREKIHFRISTFLDTLKHWPNVIYTNGCYIELEMNISKKRSGHVSTQKGKAVLTPCRERFPFLPDDFFFFTLIQIKKVETFYPVWISSLNGCSVISKSILFLDNQLLSGNALL